MKIKLNDIQFITRPDGRPLNPRGEIRDTTSLQLSMAQDGQQEPIRVRIAAEGRCEVLRGHRRVVAARALGWDEIEAEVVDDPGELGAIFAFMLSDFVREDLPPTKVAEGLRDLLGFGVTEISAAHTLGLKPDKARVFLSLLEAPPSVQARVDSGEMSMSAYEKIRALPAEAQQRAAALEKPTVDNVQAEKKKAKAELAAEQTSMIDAVGGDTEHALIFQARSFRQEVQRAWAELSPGEKIKVASILRDLLGWMSMPIDDDTDAESSGEADFWEEVVADTFDGDVPFDLDGPVMVEFDEEEE